MNSANLLESTHLKKTQSRINVLDAFTRSQWDSLSIETLTLISGVSLRCVYNVVNDLLRVGLVKKVAVKNNRSAHYSLTNKGNK